MSTLTTKQRRILAAQKKMLNRLMQTIEGSMEYEIAYRAYIYMKKKCMDCEERETESVQE